MSSSIGTNDALVFEQKRSFSTMPEQERKQPVEKATQGFREDADKDLSGDNKDITQKSELDKPSLSESLNKLFGDELGGSLLQSRALEFSVGEYEGQTVVKVVDKENKSVIRQIPSEEFIKMAQRIDSLSDEMQKARGVLLDKKA
ncbi:flagellin [Pseudoalteromonas sp. A25]|uniref:flagellar protein FlaG n=1 Tax=Pseudoalteromonas sp. A25 TaxID=116092 RepID=UPI0012607536|nr:flagellar protein FlaG [Pseudoalteromonas sp. A25]BBN81083.1 flagellin [Pseudoalteromonas sp. A25]